MPKTKVAVVKGSANPNQKQIQALVRKAIELVDGLNGITTGDLVIIKPNICAPAEPGSARCTNPLVAKAVADIVREKDARVIIAESAGVLDKYTETSIQANGYDKLRDEGYEVVDLKAKNTVLVNIPIPNGKLIKEVSIPKIIMDAKMIICLPIMKTHGAQGVTLSLKNMKGVLPDKWKKKLHTTYGVAPGLVDILSVIKPVLSIVDGLLAQEGLGPMLGTPVEMGLIIAGKDAVAVDAVTCKIMGFEPEEIPLIIGAHKAGLGTADLKAIEVVGTPIKDVARRFQRAEEALKLIIPMPDGCRVLIDEKACSGCRGEVLAAMRDMHVSGKLAVMKGWTVIAGQTENLPEYTKDKLLTVGTCTSKYKSLGRHVKGCPPPGWEIIEALIGEKLAAWH